MGVSGSGKSTLGRALAAELDWAFIEGDELHPTANVALMTAGTPLTDEHRQPWLEALNRLMADHERRGEPAVVACSALKRSYRDTLQRGLGNVRFVFLYGEPALIRTRLDGRRGHFMPPALLDSQVALLEPPTDAVLVPVDLPTAQQVALLRETLQP